MRVLGITFAGARFATPGEYREYIREKIEPVAKSGALVVLPGFTDLLLACRFGFLNPDIGLNRLVKEFPALSPDCKELHSNIARDMSCWLVTGTTLREENGGIYHEARIINPQGETAGLQRQVFLSRREREWGWSRGEDLFVFEAGTARVGILLSTDAFYPETGRILAAKGADLICHCGALPAGDNTWLQRAGMWQQVQQNQFFCVECQLSAELGGEPFAADSFVHAPCEMTEGYSGIVTRGGQDGTLHANLDYAARQTVMQNYPLLQLLNPAAYSPLSCGKGGTP